MTTETSNAYGQARDGSWWREDLTDDERWEKLLTMVQGIRASQELRKDADYARLRSYTSGPMVGFGMAASPRNITSANSSRVSFNVIKSCSDAFVAEVTEKKPKVSFVTEGGDWGLQQKARSLEKFVEGQFYECGIYEMAPQVVLDGGGIFGKGFFKLYICGEKKKARIKVERVFPWEILVDDQEGLYGESCTPRMYQQKWVDRLVLLRLYEGDEEKQEAIKEATRTTSPNSGVGYNSKADQLLVTEGWSLPTAEDEKDGRHVIAISGCTLEDEVWEYDWFPFVSYSKQDAPLGFWGISLADELDGIQREINVILMRAQRGYWLAGAGHVLAAKSAKINFNQFNNTTGSLIEWSGNGPEPKWLVPAEILPAEMYQQLERLQVAAYEYTGIARGAAMGTTPEQLDSGKAIDRALAVTDKRLQVAINRYHQVFIELSRKILCLGREIVEKHNADFGVKASINRSQMKKILLKEADLREDEYVLKQWPTDALADDPGRRMQQVQVMANAGWVAPDQAKRLLDFPDLEEANSLENASYNAVEDIIQEMIQEGRYTPPQPYLNIGKPGEDGQAKKQVQLALVKAWRDHVPEDRLQLLRDWLDDCQDIINGIGGAQTMTPQMQASAAGTPVLAPQPGVTPVMAGAPAGPPPPGPPPGAPPMAA